MPRGSEKGRWRPRLHNRTVPNVVPLQGFPWAAVEAVLTSLTPFLRMPCPTLKLGPSLLLCLGNPLHWVCLDAAGSTVCLPSHSFGTSNSGKCERSARIVVVHPPRGSGHASLGLPLPRFLRCQLCSPDSLLGGTTASSRGGLLPVVFQYLLRF